MVESYCQVVMRVGLVEATGRPIDLSMHCLFVLLRCCIVVCCVVSYSMQYYMRALRV